MNFKRYIFIGLISLMCTLQANADCDKNSITYMNCAAGQLIDICNQVAYWKVQEDCCLETSPYIIRKEIIGNENKDFYSIYMTRFDDEVYHCLLK